MFFSNSDSNNKIKTLFIVDILYMKDINAIYGHTNGNLVIKSIFDILKNKVEIQIKNVLKKIDKNHVEITIINPYIDIFMIKIHENIHHLYIKKIADLILYEITKTPIYLENLEISINIDVTIGCSKSADNDIVIYAERALHLAKLNCLHFSYFDPKFFENETKNDTFIKLIKSNISSNTIIPYYQSIVDNKNDQTYKYEALMRLNDLNGNILNPSAFLMKSKRYRLYPKLMSIMLEKVLENVKQNHIHVSVNFEYKDVLNPMLKSLLISYMHSFDIGKYITVEILESEKIQDFHVVKDFISEIKQYGAKVAIDDFGSGFSNYDHILELDVDYIKLDGSLIQKIDEDVYYNLIKSIVGFCKKENIKVIAEFVKDVAILRYVKSLEIDYSQGYYLSEPKPIQEILQENR